MVDNPVKMSKMMHQLQAELDAKAEKKRAKKEAKKAKKEAKKVWPFVRSFRWWFSLGTSCLNHSSVVRCVGGGGYGVGVVDALSNCLCVLCLTSSLFQGRTIDTMPTNPSFSFSWYTQCFQASAPSRPGALFLDDHCHDAAFTLVRSPLFSGEKEGEEGQGQTAPTPAPAPGKEQQRRQGSRRR